MGQVNGTISTHAAAAMIGVSYNTLLKWLRDGYGPPYHEMWNRRYYNPNDVTKWIESTYRVPTR